MKVYMHRRWPSVLLATAFFAVAADASAQVQVGISTAYPVETIYVSDLTPNTANSNPGMFDIVITNGLPTAQTVVMQLTVTRVAPTRSEMFIGSTDPFQITGPVRRFSTRELFGNGDVAITEYTLTPEDAVRDQVMESGRLPAGAYVFAVQVRTPLGVVLDQDEIRIDVGNPGRVELLTPGRLFGETPPTVEPLGLRFLWSSDAPNPAAQYRLRVVRHDGATSGDEAMQMNASFETLTPALSEFYPASSAALRLEPGATYAWQVTREIASSSGVERLKSPVFWFRVGGPGNQAAGGGIDESVRLRIMELFRKLGLGPELAGFRPVTATLADGRVISFETLEELIAAIESGQIALVSLRVR